MHLLMFNYEYPPLGGGGGVVHQQIAEQLALRHRVVVVTSGFGDLPARDVRNGVEIHRVPVFGRRGRATGSLPSLLSYYPASLRCGEALIREERPDVINSHFAVPTGPSATRLARRHGIPHVLCIHGGDIFDPSKRLSPHRLPVVRRVVRWVLRSADRVAAPSRNTAENARRWYGHDGAIEIIPHGIAHPPFPPASRAELGLPDDVAILVSVGRLVPRKANDELIRMLANLPYPDANLLVVGDGPERAALEALSHALGVADRVRFTGFVDETRKHQLLEAADVFVSATTHEGFGLMYLEAMGHGLPVVTYDHGGQSDFLDDGVTGTLAPLGRRDRLQAGVAQLLDNPALRARVGSHNRTLARAHSIETCAAAYERLFEQLLDTTARPHEPVIY